MAGFNNLGGGGFPQSGAPGFQIAPPRVNPVVGRGTLNLRSIPQFSGGSAGFLNNDVNVAQSRLDTSPEHQANIYMSQMGLSPTRQSYPGQTASDPYGFSSQDYLDINRFQSNPMNPEWSRNYQSIVARLRDNVGTVPGFNQGESNRFYNDLPIHLGQQFGFAPHLANWILQPGVPGA
jgi:hypothetical protein